MSDKPFLSIVIPAYNENKKLPLTLIDVDRHLSRQKYSYEIIVVHNGSTDNTKEIIKKFLPLIKKLRLVEGDNIRQGMLASKGEWRIYMNTGGAIDEILPYLKKNSRHQVLISSRTAVEKLLSYWRDDARRGFKCFSEKAALKLFAVNNVKVIAMAHKLGYKIKEISI